MLAKIRAYLIGAVALALLAYGGFRWWQGRQVAVHIKKADQLEVQQAAAGTQAETHEQTATNLKPTIQANAAAVAQASAVVAHLQHPNPPAGAQPNQPAADPQPVPPTVDLVALDAAKDALIDTLTKANADKDAALAAWEAGDAARQAQVISLQGEVKQLRAAIAAMPKDLKYSVGAVYGSSGQGDLAKGIYVDRDFSIIRAGVEVTRNTYAIANRQGWEGRVRIGFKL